MYIENEEIMAFLIILFVNILIFFSIIFLYFNIFFHNILEKKRENIFILIYKIREFSTYIINNK